MLPARLNEAARDHPEAPQTTTRERFFAALLGEEEKERCFC